MKKSKSSYDLAARTDQKFKNPMTKYQNSVENLFVSSPSTPTKNISNNNRNKNDVAAKHKVVIYFSDAYNNICNKPNDNVSNNEIEKANQSIQQSKNAESKGKNAFMTQLKSVLEEKSKFTNKFENSNNSAELNTFTSTAATATASISASKLSLKNKFFSAKPEIPEKPSIVNRINQPANNTSHKQMDEKKTSPQEEVVGNGNILPSYIESIDENNVIKLKIEQNFKKASELVDLISSLSHKKKTKTQQSKTFANSNETSSIHELNFSNDNNNNNDNDDNDDEISEPDEGYFYDWSFVQDWRRR
jgi:hypothetical protein